MNQKKVRFATTNVISRRANSNLGIKKSRHTISWRLNKINLKSRVASTKPYISKNIKMSRLKFSTEHVIWTEEQWDCVQFSDELKFNLFGCDGRRFVRRSLKEICSPQCTKSSIEFGGGSVMVFGMISVTGLALLVTVKLMKLYSEILKKHVPNLRTAINQPAIFMQDNAPFYKVKSVKTFFLRRMLLSWSGVLKALTWIVLRKLRSYKMKELRKRIQETWKNYGLIWKENWRIYTLMNARH